MVNVNNILYRLKTDLYVEGSLYRKKLSDLDELTKNKDILTEICNIFNLKDIIKKHDNIYALGLLLRTYDPNNIKVTNEITGIVASLYDYETKKYSKRQKESISEQKELLNVRLNKYISYYNNQLDVVNSSYNSLKQEVENGKCTYENNRLIQNALKYNYTIKYDQQNLLIDFMKRKNYSDKELIAVSEEIRKHNSKFKGYDVKESIIQKMLTKTFKKFEITIEEDNKYKSRLKSVGISIFEELCRSNNLDDLDTLFELFVKKEDGYTKKELSYIYKIALNNMIDYIRQPIEIVSNYDNYRDKDLRNLAILDYNENYYKFSRLYFYSKKELDKYPEDEKIVELVNDIEIERPNTFIYATNKSQNSYFLKDLEDIPCEYLDRVKSLLNGKLDGTLSPKHDECFNGGNKALSDYAKLKDDQVRIMYRHLVDNVYFVLGAFVKKDTDDFTKYYSFAKNRDPFPKNGDKNAKKIVVEDLENEIAESSKHEEKIIEYIERKHSKAHR